VSSSISSAISMVSLPSPVMGVPEELDDIPDDVADEED
jgi:hypothetical protein